MFEDIKGKTVLITGASSGLGASFARVFARYGARIAIAARRVDALENLRTELAQAGAEVVAIKLDVTDTDSIEAAIASVPWGIDILVNNAGVATLGNSLRVSPEDWDKTLNTNLRGAFFVAQTVAKQMKADRRKGAIVNISSITALRASHGLVAYSASKAGLSQMTKIMALDLAPFGIRVNALCPGYFETEMSGDYFETDEGKAMIDRVPVKKLGVLSQLEGPLLLLCSDAGSHIVGIDLPVDGGHLLSSL